MCTGMRVCSCIQLFATLWTVARQVPLSIEFFRKEHWSGLPFPTPKDLPDPGIKAVSPEPPALESGYLSTLNHLGSPPNHWTAREFPGRGFYFIFRK